jgi:hypothetical protein
MPFLMKKEKIARRKSNQRTRAEVEEQKEVNHDSIIPTSLRIKKRNSS